ncbi:hypothetical protein PTKIN_Ptkin02bG0181100 [Pterospermum kingtungense]
MVFNFLFFTVRALFSLCVQLYYFSFVSWQGQTMIWTNEKHNSYLDFLEASFVKQLHCSLKLCGCHPQEETREPYSTKELPAKGHDSSHQFLLLQEGCCQKIKYKSNDPLLESTADSCDIMGSPWLHHFTSADKSSAAMLPVPGETVIPNDGIYSRSNTNVSCKPTRSSEQPPIFHSCNGSLGCYTSEISDQNFVDEDQGEKTSCVAGVKRLKMMASLDASSNSQALPLGNLHTADDSIMKNASPKRGKKKLLSNHPKSFSSLKSDIHYFLRES